MELSQLEKLRDDLLKKVDLLRDEIDQAFTGHIRKKTTFFIKDSTTLCEKARNRTLNLIIDGKPWGITYNPCEQGTWWIIGEGEHNTWYDWLPEWIRIELASEKGLEAWIR